MSNTNAFQFSNDDEGYTTKEDVQYFIDNAGIPKNKIIGCPFDKYDSNFVSVLIENGYYVMGSHIESGLDFYKYEPKQGDIIISNPPFKNKDKLLDRLLQFNKPWALIFGIQCFNNGKFCEKLGKFKRPQYIHLKRRMVFTKDHLNYNIAKLSRPSFASMGICNDLFEKDIQVGEGANYKYDKKESK